ncbi:MAG TPA: Maf family protein [Sporolactobacillaceae bacterium]|nr:Maf family protein [Sporolactobacillaceae bacterium]
MKLYLASTSPRRQELIQRLNLPVEILKNAADETFDPTWQPKNVVQHLSKVKAVAAYNSFKKREQVEHGVLIGADTIVVVEETILGKPENKSHAKEMLQTLQGSQHKVLTGITLIDTKTGKEQTDFEETWVWMKPLNSHQIERYIVTGEPMDKAGSYGIQGIGATLIQRIEGDYFNVVGLPLSKLADQLLEFGIHIP